MKTRLTDHDIKFWLEEQYPLTVIADRYSGTYSKASYLAWPREFNEIEDEVCGSDPECMLYWDEFDDFVGKGATIEDAVADLRRQFQEERDNGFPNCRSMKDLLDAFMGKKKGE